jgi:tRNA-modifying protein YgfZ
MGAALHPDLRTTLAAVPLQRDVVHVHGEEARPFLQGQLSQDVDALAVGATARTLLLQPAGRMVAWLRVTRTDGDAFLLDVDRGGGEAVVARLRRFLLRTKAALDASTWSGLALRGPGAEAAGLERQRPDARRLPAGWPGVEGVDLLAPEGVAPADEVPLASQEALEALRIEAGVPALGAEIVEATIPAELGRWLVDAAVSFTKGCYAGQELVARVDSRGGNVPRPLRGLRLDGEDLAVRGATVVAGGAEVGALTSVARSEALGVVALAPLPRAVEPGQVVEVLAGGARTPATVAELPLR